MAVGHLTIRRYKINIRPEYFRPMIFQSFGEAADLVVGQLLCPLSTFERSSIFKYETSAILKLYYSKF